VGQDRFHLLPGDLDPEPVLLGQEHGVGEDASLGAGEKSVGARAWSEPLHVAGHIVVEETVAVGAEKLQASAPSEVGDAATL
jgi:hypothetical protein